MVKLFAYFSRGTKADNLSIKIVTSAITPKLYELANKKQDSI